MTDCDDLAYHLHAQTRVQIRLAMLAEAVSVAAMHLDLAQFSEERARAAEELCGPDD